MTQSTQPSNVTRRQMLVSLAALPIAATMLPRFAFAQDPAIEEPPRVLAFDTAAVEVKDLGSEIYVISGPGGNITVVAGIEGAVVIDSGISPRAKDILGAIGKLPGPATGPTVSTLINTHWHADHAGGNAAMTDAGANSRIAHDNVYARMKAGGRIEFFAMDMAPAEPKALSTTTFDNNLTLRRNGKTLVLEHVGPAHTDGDTAIWIPDINALVTGDLFFNGFYPFIDYSSGGSIDGMIKAGQHLLEKVDDKTKIVSGHGPVGNKAQYAEFVQMLITARDRLTPLAAKGMKLTDVQMQKPLADLDAKWGQALFHSSNFIRLVYPAMLTNK